MDISLNDIDNTKFELTDKIDNKNIEQIKVGDNIIFEHEIYGQILNFYIYEIKSISPIKKLIKTKCERAIKANERNYYLCTSNNLEKVKRFIAQQEIDILINNIEWNKVSYTEKLDLLHEIGGNRISYKHKLESLNALGVKL